MVDSHTRDSSGSSKTVTDTEVGSLTINESVNMRNGRRLERDSLQLIENEANFISCN